MADDAGNDNGDADDAGNDNDAIDNVISIDRYMNNPFSDEVVRRFDDQRDVRLLSEREKNSLVLKLKNFKHPSGSDAARLQGYSMDDAPRDSEGVPLKLSPSYKYPFGCNNTMKTKTLNYWILVRQDLRSAWLNAILNPPPAEAQVVTGAATKHECARVLHIVHDDENNHIYNKICTSLNRQGLDRRRTNLAEEDNGYTLFTDIFNNPEVQYDHPVPGDFTNAFDEKFTALYPNVKDIYCNHDQANMYEENIKFRDAAWFKETWKYIKSHLVKVVADFTKSGTYSEEDSQWIQAAAHAESLCRFNPNGLDWVLYAFTFVDRLAMDTYNKIIEGNHGLEDGVTPTNPEHPTNPERPSRSRSRSGSDAADMASFVAVEQERLVFQRTNDGERIRVAAATSLANINPLNEEEHQQRSEGIRFLSSMLRPPPPLPPPSDNTRTPPLPPLNNNNNNNRRNNTTRRH